MESNNMKNPLQKIAGLLIVPLIFLAGSCTDLHDPVSSEREVVEIKADHDHELNKHIYEMSKKELAYGWTTFRFVNETHSLHFFNIIKMPQEAIDAAQAAGQPLRDHLYETVTVPFQEEFNPYISGEITYQQFVNNLIGAISQTAPWYLDPGTVPMGGPGFTSTDQTSQTTVNLQPGTYIAECYVKDENQEFHTYNGMLELFTVKEESSGEEEPGSTMEIMIAQSGLDVPDKIEEGEQTVAINFGDQTAYAHLLGHNAHLVRLEENYDQGLLDEVATWMDWTKEEGLLVEAPAGATFLGGSMQMVGGSTAYLEVDLEPGEYAWIAEVPDPAEKGMLKTFSVPD
ncbi:MAG: hypothetical protein U5K69_29865 [Balneolaceae bacterium]|nr:hypothetical protein [Balneolaceae bacterium]